MQKLAAFWKNHTYFIIGEKSMISQTFFTRLSAAIGKAKSQGGSDNTNRPFGGVNVILVSDFHQFPPVVGKPLYWRSNPSKDNNKELLGRQLYEQFTTIVRLKEQVRIQDPEWLDLLQHIHRGSCQAQHIEMLRSLIITNPICPPTDFVNKKV